MKSHRCQALTWARGVGLVVGVNMTWKRCWRKYSIHGWWNFPWLTSFLYLAYHGSFINIEVGANHIVGEGLRRDYDDEENHRCPLADNFEAAVRIQSVSEGMTAWRFIWNNTTPYLDRSVPLNVYTFEFRRSKLFVVYYSKLFNEPEATVFQTLVKETISHPWLIRHLLMDVLTTRVSPDVCKSYICWNMIWTSRSFTLCQD